MTSQADAVTTLLRQLCVIELEQHHVESILENTAAINDWDMLVHQAEIHGLSNLVYHHLINLGVEIPAIAKTQFMALKARHRRANRARHKSLEEILEKFSERGLASVILKGAALVHLIYPSPEMRPMSDIDILVKGAEANDAQQCLRDIGFRAGVHQTGFLADHHHLPIASKTENGIGLQIEIHHDALSGDVVGSIRLDAEHAPLQRFTVGQQSAWALGHTDMLRHLCHHTFEPVENIKLGAVADLYGYACKYYTQLDKDEIAEKHPYVLNIFTLLHYLSPLPRLLQEWIKPPTAPAPSDVGKGYIPMSKTITEHKNIIARVKHLVNAPDWWLHGFYNIDPENSLVWTRWVSHPLQGTIIRHRKP